MRERSSDTRSWSSAENSIPVAVGVSESMIYLLAEATGGLTTASDNGEVEELFLPCF